MAKLLTREKLIALQQYPRLREDQVRRLYALRASDGYTARLSNGQGGGSYSNYCREIGVPF
jgi:hypothetical protein